MCSADGSTLLTDKDAILERLTDHINSVLNRPTAVSDDDINRLSQKESNVLLDEFPTATNTKKTIRHLSSNKAPGANAISTEIFKADRLPMTWKLTELWRKAILQELKDASIIHNPSKQTERESSCVTTTHSLSLSLSLSYRLLKRY